jgi:hypothetical protein
MVEKRYFFGKANADMHTIIGCACGLVKDFLIKSFPKNYFRNIFITTRMGGNEVDYENDNMLDKRSKPILSLNPKINFQSDSTFVGHLPDPFFTNHMIFKNMNKYVTIFHNEEEEYHIAVAPDRYRVEFDIKIKVVTYLQELNLANFIKRRFAVLRPFYLNNITFQTEIPKSLIKILLEEKGIDVKNQQSLNEFNEYIERFTYNNVEFKKVLSTGNFAHVYTYECNTLCRLEEPQLEDFSRDEMNEQEPTLTMNMWVDFWAPGSYIFRSGNPIRYPIDDLEVPNIEDMLEIVFLNSTRKIIKKKTIGNYNLIEWLEFYSDDNAKIDMLDFSEVIGDDLKLLIKYILARNEDISQYFMFKIYMDDQEMTTPDEYVVHWDQLKLQSKNPRINYNYSAGFYGDLKLVKDKLNEMYKEKALINSRQLSITKTPSVDIDGGLLIEFNTNIRNSIISLNGLFYSYTIIDDTHIKYNSSIPYEVDLALNNIYVYNWFNVQIDNVLQPTNIVGDYIEFDGRIVNCYILFYQNKLIEAGKHEWNKKLIKPVGIGNIAGSNVNDYRLITFKSIDGLSKLSVLQLKGLNLLPDKLSYFQVEIDRSIITYNGINECYDIYNNVPRVVSYIKSESVDLLDGEPKSVDVVNDYR